MPLAPALDLLEATALSRWVQESQYGFAIVVAVHLLSLTLSVGTLVWFDLRLLGLTMRQVPVSRVYRQLLPLMVTGFILAFASGVVLFAAYATSAYGNVYFRLKLAAFVVAGVNALVYHRFTERRISNWDEGNRPPLPARAAGLVSILAWTVAIMAGRMMSYTIF